MGRIIGRKEIENILVGATFLGAGGGGSLQPALDLMDRLEKQDGYSLEIELISIDEFPTEEYAAMVASLGSPLALLNGEFGPDSALAFKSFQKALAMENKKVSCLYSGELGGFNTFIPMLVSILSDRDPSKRIRLLDVDGNGRAVPELNTSLNAARGFPPCPIGMGTMNGDQIILYPTDSESGEKMARALCQTSGMQIGFSTWGMDGGQLRQNAVCGALSACERIGQLLSDTRAEQSLCDSLRESLNCRQIVAGVVEEVDVQVVNGFDLGQCRVRDSNGQITTLVFQNENIFARSQAGEILVNVPDLICIACAENGRYRPLTNADTAKGMSVEVVALPADPLWWDQDKKAYECWLPILERAGFSGEMKRLSAD